MDDDGDTAGGVVDHLARVRVVLDAVAGDGGAIAVNVAREVHPGHGVDCVAVDNVGGEGVTNDAVIVDAPGVVRSRIGS